MSTFLVGSLVRLTVTITDRDSNADVDPATLAFSLKAPESSNYGTSTYSWNGSVWASSESVIGTPAKGDTGIFTLDIHVPYANAAAGAWKLGWRSTANAGLGEGSGAASFVVVASEAL